MNGWKTFQEEKKWVDDGCGGETNFQQKEVVNPPRQLTVFLQGAGGKIKIKVLEVSLL
jgi:hypothetical protein